MGTDIGLLVIKASIYYLNIYAGDVLAFWPVSSSNVKNMVASKAIHFIFRNY